MKTATKNILRSTEYESFLSYLLGSLTEDALRFLQELAIQGRVQSESSEIPVRLLAGLDYRLVLPESAKGSIESPERLSNLFWDLKGKEIVEDVEDGGSSRVRLRVGILAYPPRNHETLWL